MRRLLTTASIAIAFASMGSALAQLPPSGATPGQPPQSRPPTPGVPPAATPPAATEAPPEAVAPPAAPAQPEPVLGGPGESCRARSDCRAGLKCMASTCRDEREGMTCGATSDCGGELKCINQVCTSQIAGMAAMRGAPGSPAGPAEPAGPGWMDFELTGTHPFVGITVAGGPALPVLLGGGSGPGVEGSFLFALRAGALFDKTEVGIELSPMTYLTITAADPSFQFNVFAGSYLDLADHVYWPLRFGLGMIAGNTPRDRVALQARADVVGVAYQLGHLLLEAHLPSFRFATEFQDIALLSWDFGASASYAF